MVAAARQTRLAAALVLLAALALGAGWLIAYGPDPDLPSMDEQVAALPDHISDRELYLTAAQQVAEGEGYYPAMAALHRANDYPLFPFYTVRPPLLVWIVALLGADGARYLSMSLLLLCAGLWARRLDREGFRAVEVLAAAGLIVMGGLGAAFHLYMHEYWCGLLIGIAAALWRPERWRAALAVAVVAAGFREFAVLFLFAGLALALLSRRRAEVLGVAVAVALVAALYALHYAAVDAVRLPSDSHSAGWWALLGPVRAWHAVAQHSFFIVWGATISGLFATFALAGWAGMGPSGRLPALFATGMTVLLACAARPENGYWAQMLNPWMLAGLAFMPRLALRAAGCEPQSE